MSENQFHYDHRLFTPRDLEPHEIVSLCERIGKPSAQANVYLLPEEFIRDMYVDITTFEVAEVRRVVKILQTPSEIEQSIIRLNIESERERREKLGHLIIMGFASTIDAIRLAVRRPEVDLLFGQPRLLESPTVLLGSEIRYNMSYTQDLTTPVSELLASLDMSDEQDLRAGCQLVDDYIDALLLLCSHGLYDPGFKFTDNCAQGIPASFEDSLDNFRVIDLGELSSNSPRLFELIRKRDWEDNVNRPEYTQLPLELQAYFNEAMKRRFTVDAVRKVWCTRISDTPIESLSDQIADLDLNRNMMDNTVPPEIAPMLRRR